MENLAYQTLATIVTSNHQAVPVLEKYSLDFCCKGKRTLTDACKEKGISVEALMEELESASGERPFRFPFESMSAEELTGYIVIHHHLYVKKSMPVILGHLQKVAGKHGERFPFMVKVFELFLTVNDEMLLHMNKEENILFPRINEIVALKNQQQGAAFNAAYIQGPVAVMEHEHDQAGTLMYMIRQLTNNYTPPADACTTFRVVLAELQEFEEDLHRHVHLENNILFPMAIQLVQD